LSMNKNYFKPAWGNPGNKNTSELGRLTDTCNGLLRAFFAVFILLSFSENSFSQHSDLAISNKIDTLMRELYDRGQFNGSILVSVNKKIAVAGIAITKLKATADARSRRPIRFTWLIKNRATS